MPNPPHHVLLLGVGVLPAVQLAKRPVMHEELAKDAAPGVEGLQEGERGWAGPQVQ